MQNVFDSEHPAQNMLPLHTSHGPWPINLPLSARTKDADDETLITLLKEGSKTESQQALETIFVRHHQDVWRYVRSRVSVAGDADEIAAATWLTAIEKIYNFVWTGVPIKSWLLSIAHRKMLEFFNSPFPISLEHLNEEHEEALHYIATQLNLIDHTIGTRDVPLTVKREADELLHKMIAQLSGTERKIIMLIYFENLENATEVAERLNMNKNTIRVYHKRARDKLRASPELSNLFPEAPA